MSTLKDNSKGFIRLCISTILAVYFLIFVGGLVRSTGSGMGCPDWPKCFGAYVPPTDVSQLPIDYQDIYSEKRVQKNLKLANYLETIGFKELAFTLRNDESIKEEALFNPVKTWIEYVNRLIGVIIGFLILFTAYRSLAFRKSKPVITIVSISALVLVVVQAWIGSIVVSTNLLPGMISIHMALALVIVGMLIFAYYRALPREMLKISPHAVRNIKAISMVALALFLIQIFLGVQVREAIDSIARSIDDRSLWIDALGWEFYLHRSYSLLILGLQVYIVYKAWPFIQENGNDLLKRISYALLALIVLEILSGVVMAYFAVPAFAQPIHLLIASVIAGLHYFTILVLGNSVQATEKKEYAVS